MRNKTSLIDGFIKQNVDNDKAGFRKAKADGTIDLESRLTEYVSKARNKAIEDMATEEGLNLELVQEFFREYDYLQREKPEIIQKAINEKKVGLLVRTSIFQRVMARIHAIISTFSWE